MLFTVEKFNNCLFSFFRFARFQNCQFKLYPHYSVVRSNMGIQTQIVTVLSHAFMLLYEQLKAINQQMGNTSSYCLSAQPTSVR